MSRMDIAARACTLAIAVCLIAVAASEALGQPPLSSDALEAAPGALDTLPDAVTQDLPPVAPPQGPPDQGLFAMLLGRGPQAGPSPRLAGVPNMFGDFFGLGGNIVASQVPGKHDAFDNAAALAAGSFAATRELASIIGEKGFHTIMHKGAVKGLLIQALGEEFIVVIFLGSDSVEGMVRLILKKIAPQILSILEGADDSAGEGPGDLEIKRTDT